MTAARILQVLRERGALTGAELQDALPEEPLLELWRAARRSPEVGWRAIGRRYLRLDRTVPGFARLSPSIKREFLTYTVLFPAAAPEAGEGRARRLAAHIREVSREKHLLARDRIKGVLERLARSGELDLEQVTVLLAGDVVYEMAHDVPRPEVSTGKLVRGSDLDIVVVAQDGTDVQALDQALLREKHFLLTHPSYREEVDYIVKDFSKVKEQLRFDTFEHKVACKILEEALHLAGSVTLFGEVRRCLKEAGVPAQLAALAREARRYRAEAEARLLRGPDLAPEEAERYFYTREEDPEIF